MQAQVILVDEDDRPIGLADKTLVHRQPQLHRAFSAFVFRGNGDMLLQRRAAGKYHSAGLWSNACCSHPRPGEDTLREAELRLVHEMGLSVRLALVGTLTYRIALGSGWAEHEFDHVYAGHTDRMPRLHMTEADAYRSVAWDDLMDELAREPGQFSRWFCHIMRELRGPLENFREGMLAGRRTNV